ncbi:monofunctional biosynthetic peptidoglycan transglycosylase [Segetibacter sp. 3557_3]|uniref:monofunctional biosynthetic peptidoglycan transglycosylase n=1 Tax=Segetibacter sp. 3557_3 TaxID=2547429 RepID=UPI001058B228|nr:monofunctional biosynthetic peptidoglycan transglycosylase [Segetibacter sp. 3557_3]TDH20629.1 monofunctional biosynthetic peptidoglycan transglycosylase [Segetibacter sp. 3557_3]
MTVRDFFGKIFRLVFKILLWGIVTSFIYLVICKWIMPPVTLTQLGSAVSGYGLKRDYVDMEQISPYAKLAAMASEDQLFPDHNGFDWKSLEKSLKGNPRKKNKVRGAGSSTISQQVAKNVFLWQGSGITRYIRKLPEVYFTFMIEWIWGKRRILEVYLNIAEMGPGIFGIEAASQAYFKKAAANVNRIEAAMIIACLPNPKKYTVKPMSSWVRWKHRHILRQMVNIGDDPDVQKLIR